MRIKIVPNTKPAPISKLADAELHFDASDGLLAGLRLQGFAIWRTRTGSGYNVTYPARSYSVNGERRTFSLLRPSTRTPRRRTTFATPSSPPTTRSRPAPPSARPARAGTTRHLQGADARHLLQPVV